MYQCLCNAQCALSFCRGTHYEDLDASPPIIPFSDSSDVDREYLEVKPSKIPPQLEPTDVDGYLKPTFIESEEEIQHLKDFVLPTSESVIPVQSYDTPRTLLSECQSQQEAPEGAGVDPFSFGASDGPLMCGADDQTMTKSVNV